MEVSGFAIPSMTLIRVVKLISIQSVETLILHLGTMSMISFSSTAVINIELIITIIFLLLKSAVEMTQTKTKLTIPYFLLVASMYMCPTLLLCACLLIA